MPRDSRREDVEDYQETEFAKLKAKFEDHLIEHRIKSKDYELRQERQDLKHEQNMQAIAELTAATQDVVAAWKVANGLQRFVKWLSGFAVVGAVITFVSNHFPHMFK